MEVSRTSAGCSVAVIVALVLAATIIVLGPSASGEYNIKVGNYWEYVFDYTDPDGIRYNGNLTEVISGTSTRMVAGSSTSVFLLDYSGGADISGSYTGTPVSGAVTIGGLGVRIASNFSLLSDSQAEVIELSMLGVTVTVALGWSMAYSPPADVYVGDSAIALGTEINSSTHITGETWFDAFGTNDTQILDNDTIITLTVVAENVVVTVPAGSFSCYKMLVTTYYDDGYSDSSWYYFAEEVGNYVKFEGGLAYGGITDHLLLRSYSYSSDTEPPTANAGHDITISVGTNATLNASASIDNKGIVNYTWSFDDQGAKVLYGKTVTYRFDRPGLYNITLTVTDGGDNSDVDFVEVRVIDDIPPVAVAGPDRNATEGDTVELNGTSSSDNIGITNYTWTFVDGISRTIYGAVINYTFNDSGVYEVVLTVKDGAGNVDSDSLTITVNSTSDSAKPENTSLVIGLAALAAVIVAAVAALIVMRRRRPPVASSIPEQGLQAESATLGPSPP